MKKLSLKLRLALIIGSLVFISSLFLTYMASKLSRQQIEHDQSALLQSMAERMATQLASDMSSRANEILFLANLETVRNPKAAATVKQALFERMRQSYPFYAWIGMTDSAGNIVVGTDSHLVGKNVAQRDWFLHGRDNIFFGDAHDAFLLAKLLPKPLWDDLPLRLVDVSAPVFDQSGKFLGVICGHLSLDWAFAAREKMLHQLAHDQLDMLVLNREGKVLMGTPSLPSLKVELGRLTAVQALQSNTQQVSVELWPDGKRYLTAAVREMPFQKYPGMGWSVIARKPESEAFRAARHLSLFILLGGVVTAVVFALIIWLVLKQQLKPLEQISAAARRIRDEDLTASIPQPEGEGELAVFARSLTALVHTLQKKNEELLLAGRVFEESGQGIVITDADNIIVRVNQSFSRITGYTLVELVGKTPSILRSDMQDSSFYSAMWAAIRQKGNWQGEIYNRAKNGRVYPEWLAIDTLKDGQGRITHHIGIFDDITEKKEYENRLVHLANYDQLTGLPNRNLMQNKSEVILKKMAEQKQSMALLFIDLDKFKNINDTLGHPAGDQVLQELSARFRSQAAEPNVLSRWGGDEFVVVMPEADIESATALARKLISSLQRPFTIEGKSYHLAMSAGVAMYPADADTVSSLLRCADIAMYRAKQEGSNQVRFFDRSMNAAVEYFLKIDSGLRQALSQNGQGLSLLFQPQFDSSGKIASAEALARWHSPELGPVSPASFIPVAEETGQIVQLGRWIIDEAVKSQALLQKKGYPLPVAINCSARQLREGSMVTTLHEACQMHQVEPANIMIEITESAIMGDEIAGMETLSRLRQLGFRISIDDFGTGYSCLNYIQKIHPAEIKIDRSFVKKMLIDSDSLNIVSFTMSLARSLNIEVVAEGVEAEAELSALHAMGPVKIQGYLLGKPMSLENLIERLSV